MLIRKYSTSLFTIIFTIFLLADALPFWIFSHFEEFQEEFSKNYETPAELLYRISVFFENFKEIQEHNSEGHSFRLGLNRFADLSEEEFAYEHLQPLKEGLFNSENLRHESLLDQNVTSGVDWVQSGVITSVKSTGIQCPHGNWADAAIGTLEASWGLKTGALREFSSQQIIDCLRVAGNQGCDGGSALDALIYTQKYGVSLLRDYPSSGVQEVCKFLNLKTGKSWGSDGKPGNKESDVGFLHSKKTDSNLSPEIPFEIQGGSALEPFTRNTGFGMVWPQKNEVSFLNSLSRRPMVVGIDASSLQFYSSGIFSRSNCSSKPNHYFLAVGFVNEKDQQYITLKNNWGNTWGEAGYLRIAVSGNGSGECGLYSFGFWAEFAF